MDERYKEALENSIKKWDTISQTGHMPDHLIECELCTLDKELAQASCESCPVYHHTGESGCNNTPYAVWGSTDEDSQEEKDAAKDEGNFLRSLLKEFFP